MSTKKERSNHSEKEPSRAGHQNGGGGGSTRPRANAKEAREQQGERPVQEKAKGRESQNN